MPTGKSFGAGRCGALRLLQCSGHTRCFGCDEWPLPSVVLSVTQSIGLAISYHQICCCCVVCISSRLSATSYILIVFQCFLLAIASCLRARSYRYAAVGGDQSLFSAVLRFGLPLPFILAATPKFVAHEPSAPPLELAIACSIIYFYRACSAAASLATALTWQRSIERQSAGTT